MGVCKAFKAFSTSARRNSFSSFAFIVGFPSGWGIATAGTILFAPTVFEIGTTVAICTTGKTFSISLTIVAPQRVQVPHVEVRMTACTPAFTSLPAISDAKRFAFATLVPLPTVV